MAGAVAHLVSVEDDAAWYRRVKGEVENSNVDLGLAPTSVGCQDINQLLMFPDSSFDFILIDGSCRDRCIAAAVENVSRALSSSWTMPMPVWISTVSRVQAALDR